MIVVDTNVVLYLLIPGEHTAAAREAFQADPEWVAPLYWRIEFLNVLSTYCRSAKLAVVPAMTLFSEAVEIVRDMPFEPSPARVLDLSVASGCSGYDCIFVAAAEMNRLPLVSFDQKILKAFPKTVITPEMVEAWFEKRNGISSE